MVVNHLPDGLYQFMPDSGTSSTIPNPSTYTNHNLPGSTEFSQSAHMPNYAPVAVQSDYTPVSVNSNYTAINLQPCLNYAAASINYAAAPMNYAAAPMIYATAGPTNYATAVSMNYTAAPTNFGTASTNFGPASTNYATAYPNYAAVAMNYTAADQNPPTVNSDLTCPAYASSSPSANLDFDSTSSMSAMSNLDADTMDKPQHLVPVSLEATSTDQTQVWNLAQVAHPAPQPPAAEPIQADISLADNSTSLASDTSFVPTPSLSESSLLTQNQSADKHLDNVETIPSFNPPTICVIPPSTLRGQSTYGTGGLSSIIPPFLPDMPMQQNETYLNWL